MTAQVDAQEAHKSCITAQVLCTHTHPYVVGWCVHVCKLPTGACAGESLPGHPVTTAP